MVPVPLKPLTVPLVTVISLAIKLVVLSLKVAVTGNAAVTVAAAAEVRLTVGAILSKVRVKAVAAVLLFPAASVATLLGTLTVTVPWPVGVTVKL